MSQIRHPGGFLEKNGFELEGLLKQAVDKNGNIYNLCIYGKVKP